MKKNKNKMPAGQDHLIPDLLQSGLLAIEKNTCSRPTISGSFRALLGSSVYRLHNGSHSIFNNRNLVWVGQNNFDIDANFYYNGKAAESVANREPNMVG